MIEWVPAESDDVATVHEPEEREQEPIATPPSETLTRPAGTGAVCVFVTATVKVTVSP